MKKIDSLKVWLLFLVVLGCSTIGFAQTSPDIRSITALNAWHKARKEAPVGSKDYLLSIYGARNDLSVVPTDWTVTFYDPVAKQSTSFSVGKTSVSEPQVQNEEQDLRDYIIDTRRFQVDSNEVLYSLGSLKKIQNVGISSLDLHLYKSRPERGAPPAWAATVYVIDKQTWQDEKEMGKVLISAQSGRIMDTDLEK